MMHSKPTFAPFRWLLPVLLLMLLPGPVLAADINLTLNQEIENGAVAVSVENKSDLDVAVLSLEVERNDQRAFQPFPEARTIHPRERLSTRFALQAPPVPGSYAQRVTVRYVNDNQVLSLSGVAYVNFGAKAILVADDTRLKDAIIAHEGSLELTGPDPGAWQPILPYEVSVVSDSIDGKVRTIRLRANRPGFVTNYPIYAVRSEMIGEQHHTRILSATLRVDDHPRAAPAATFRGRLDNATLAVITIGSAIFFVALWRRRPSPEQPWATSGGKYAARLFWLSAGYLALKNADLYLDQAAFWVGGVGALQWPVLHDMPLLGLLPTNPVAALLGILRDNLRGANYAFFFQWFADPYVAACVLLSLFYSRYLDSAKPLQQDKYGAALAALLLPWRAGHQAGMPYPAPRKTFLPPARLGFLSIGVKLFFLPYLASWVINNIIHQWNLTQGLTFSFSALNAYLLALFLLTDTAIFAFGYAFESHHTKSEIRSVEPTLLGWLVCLWCYPPLNTFSFRIFDYPLFDIHVGIAAWGEPLALAAITLCWGIFAWASVALGFKASNLTNRGIVSHGPYRWCRHPAYAAKMLAWVIEGVLLGKYFLGLLLGFALIYFLRAWTEERHLSMDPDYIEYRKRVRYWFIPGVI